MKAELQVSGLMGEGYAPFERLMAVAEPGQLQGGAGEPVTEPQPVATSGADTLIGGDLDDVIRGLGGHDLLNGMRGNDTLYGQAGNDRLVGAWGNDVLYGGAGDDSLQGFDARDLLVGGSGNDVLEGLAGPDTLQGGKGDDWLMGGIGADVFVGGAGADLFELERGVGQEQDMFVDFTVGEDLIVMRYPGGFGINHTGPLEAADFDLGRVATKGTTRILYDQATGDILFDPDGYGITGGPGGEGFVIGHVSPGTALSFSDFLIYAGDHPLG